MVESISIFTISSLASGKFFYLVGGRYVHPLRACADIRNNMAANPHAEGVWLRVKFVVLKPSLA